MAFMPTVYAVSPSFRSGKFKLSYYPTPPGRVSASKVVCADSATGCPTNLLLVEWAFCLVPWVRVQETDANPQLVKEPGGWKWSSFRHHALRENGVVEIESEWTGAGHFRDTFSGLDLAHGGDLQFTGILLWGHQHNSPPFHVAGPLIWCLIVGVHSSQ